MNARARAGLEFADSVLRYAAVEMTAEERRLLRLGHCDFDFDITAGMLEEEPKYSADAVAEAIKDVFQGIGATHFHVVLHPPACVEFVTPVPADRGPAERNEQLHWEAGQLMDLDEEAFKIVVHPVRSENRKDVGSIDWFYVAALRRNVYANLMSLLQQAEGHVVPHVSGSVQAASAIARRMEAVAASGEIDARSRLLIGQYGNRTEYTLIRTDRRRSSCYWEDGSSEDARYAVAQLVDTADATLAAIDEVLVYGPQVQEAGLKNLTDMIEPQPIRFNPFEALNMDTGRVSDDFPYWEYVTTVGVTL